MKSRVHCLWFESLESRALLSSSHIVPGNAAPAAVRAPLVLDGTLAVDNKATTTTLNSDGSTTASTPVAGRLGTLGEFHGVWLETTDAYGNNTGLDVLRIHDSKGTITLVFDNQNPGKAHPASHRASYFEDVERVYHDTGAFAGAAERGSIELVTNSDQSVITSLRLHTQNS